MKFRTIITEDDGAEILDTGEMPEDSEVVYTIDDQKVTIINKVQHGRTTN